MAKAPATKEGQATREFKVAKGFRIGDPNKKRPDKRAKEAGDTIRLTKEQATYYMKMGAIELELPDFEDEKHAAAVDKSFDDNPAEAGAGDQAEGEGDDAAGADSSTQTDEADGKATPRRRRSSN